VGPRPLIKLSRKSARRPVHGTWRGPTKKALLANFLPLASELDSKTVTSRVSAAFVGFSIPGWGGRAATLLRGFRLECAATSAGGGAVVIVTFFRPGRASSCLASRPFTFREAPGLFPSMMRPSTPARRFHPIRDEI